MKNTGFLPAKPPLLSEVNSPGGLKDEAEGSYTITNIPNKIH